LLLQIAEATRGGVRHSSLLLQEPDFQSKEEIMRTLVLCLVLLSALLFGAFPSQSRATGQKQRATVRLVEPVLLQGVLLEGEYLFVHDDAAMQRGEACTYIYKGNAEIRGKLVASFHCIPQQREKASRFVVRTAQNKSGQVELREYQFGGDTETHLVPTP
jgi:hypothetical protein